MKAFWRFIGLITLAVVVIAAVSCNGSGTQLIGVSLTSNAKSTEILNEKNVEFYEVAVEDNGKTKVVYKTPNSVFPSLLQLSVPSSANNVKVLAYGLDANGAQVLVALGSTDVDELNKNNVVVQLSSQN